MVFVNEGTRVTGPDGSSRCGVFGALLVVLLHAHAVLNPDMHLETRRIVLSLVNCCCQYKLSYSKYCTILRYFSTADGAARAHLGRDVLLPGVPVVDDPRLGASFKKVTVNVS